MVQGTIEVQRRFPMKSKPTPSWIPSAALLNDLERLRKEQQPQRTQLQIPAPPRN